MAILQISRKYGADGRLTAIEVSNVPTAQTYRDNGFEVYWTVKKRIQAPEALALTTEKRTRKWNQKKR